MKLLDIKWINWLIIAGIVVSIVIGFCGINGGSPNPIGREMKYIVSGSMDGNPQDQYDIPEIPVYSVVVVNTNLDSLDDFEVGDIVAFQYYGSTVVHRVISIQYDDSGNIVSLTAHGDSRPSGDTQTVTSGMIDGKVVGVSETLGAITHFAKSSSVLILVLILVLIVAACSLRDILAILREGK